MTALKAVYPGAANDPEGGGALIPIEQTHGE
jgi:hypothetical protein